MQISPYYAQFFTVQHAAAIFFVCHQYYVLTGVTEASCIRH